MFWFGYPLVVGFIQVGTDRGSMSASASGVSKWVPDLPGGGPGGLSWILVVQSSTIHIILFRTDRDQQKNMLRVHTNKVEGFWSHVKHKIKPIRGTSEPLKSFYIDDAVFRQNCDAENNNMLELFFERISMIYRIDNYELQIK
uniref:Uncharacterized protein n=1 Tax=Ditylenchus dipsaci TaxID=166011 RepID=A0A915DIT2_9BILA